MMFAAEIIFIQRLDKNRFILHFFEVLCVVFRMSVWGLCFGFMNRDPDGWLAMSWLCTLSTQSQNWLQTLNIEPGVGEADKTPGVKCCVRPFVNL